ncbi:deoxyribonuclease IV [Paenibacillus flagellatus]|uniref:Endonuclease IV n=1 Tax=Paenibacillus flagellatus TaxID=2211139 RepID=A0A2V5KV15_9BACL|nr:deoxyribonuclease IV [Paenibacillus flagellatus]PYI55887.1 endonuclease IV [Paenibacillus flagellatus]
MLFGAHVSIRHGYAEAAKLARRIGGRSFQYFPKNPRSLALKSFDRRDAESCAAFCREHGMQSIAHTPYPTNLAADAGERRSVVVRSLLNDLEIADACGSVGVIVHFGIYKGAEPLDGYKNIVATLNEVLRSWSGSAMLLIENQSGEHARMGMTFEELVGVRNLCAKPELVGFCLDTCHAFASGLWSGNDWDEVEAKGVSLGYFEHLKAIHLNDSVYPSRSYKDRHANIGKGEIGAEPFRRLFASRYVQSLPGVLETPVAEGRSHAEEIAFLNELASSRPG